jgi:hypothetical protein
LRYSRTCLAAANGQWVLAASTLTYHISHPLHESEGVSHDARGKGTCQAGQCNFLIAVPVKSFVTGDSNRDLHMLQVTRGAQFPLVTVRVSLPESVVGTASFHCDVDIEFAGQKAAYHDVAFQAAKREMRFTSRRPFRLRWPILRSSRRRCSRFR